MDRTGNTIGAEGRRQHDEDDPQYGDKPDREERIADREAREAEEEGVEALQTEAELDAADPVPEPDEAAVGDVQSPEGVKPGTASEIEEEVGGAREE